jgi:hypothetical protein
MRSPSTSCAPSSPSLKRAASAPPRGGFAGAISREPSDREPGVDVHGTARGGDRLASRGPVHAGNHRSRHPGPANRVGIAIVRAARRGRLPDTPPWHPLQGRSIAYGGGTGGPPPDRGPGSVSTHRGARFRRVVSRNMASERQRDQACPDPRRCPLGKACRCGWSSATWGRVGSSGSRPRSSGRRVKRSCAPIWRTGRTKLLAPPRERSAKPCFGAPTGPPPQARRSGPQPCLESDEGRAHPGREQAPPIRRRGLGAGDGGFNCQSLLDLCKASES